MKTEEPVTVTLGVEGIVAPWVRAELPAEADSGAGLAGEAERILAAIARERGTVPWEERKRAVRAMLRFGRYSPSGRGKPASEYLAAAAAKGSFPRINDAVDVVNLVSAEFLLPASLIDLDLAASHRFLIRRGRKGESYVFNPSGQVLSLEDLLLLAGLPGDLPRATPVKDGQATKVHPGTRRVLALIYAPLELADPAGQAVAEMKALLESPCGARCVAGRAEGSPSNP